MEPKESDIKSERGKVIKAFKLLKEDIKKIPGSFLSEFDLQGRLYYHLCNEFKSDYNRIHLEYFPPDFKYDKEEYKVKQEKCIKNYVPKEVQNKIILIEKKGKYDL